MCVCVCKDRQDRCHGAAVCSFPLRLTVGEPCPLRSVLKLPRVLNGNIKKTVPFIKKWAVWERRGNQLLWRVLDASLQSARLIKGTNCSKWEGHEKLRTDAREYYTCWKAEKNTLRDELVNTEEGLVAWWRPKTTKRRVNVAFIRWLMSGYIRLINFIL